MCEYNRCETSCCWPQNVRWLSFFVICMLAFVNRTALAQSFGTCHSTLTVIVVMGQEGASVDASIEPEDVPTDSVLAEVSVEQSDIATVAEIGEPDASNDANGSLQSALLETPTSNSPPSAPHPLSVEPTSQMLPKDRPSWIDMEPDLESEVQRFVVASIPTSLKNEVDSNLDATLVEAVKNYVNQQFGADADELINDRLTAAFIQTNLVDDKKSYVAELQTGEGPLFQKWVMVEITPEQRNHLRLWVHQQVQRQRVLPLGLLLSALLTTVGLTHLILRRRTTVPDNLKATQIQPANPVPFGNSKSTLCRKSRCARFGAITALAIAVLTAIAISSPGNSSGKKKRHNQRRDVELRLESAKVPSSPTMPSEPSAPSHHHGQTLEI